MKKLIGLLLLATVIFLLCSCSSSIKKEHTEEGFVFDDARCIYCNEKMHLTSENISWWMPEEEPDPSYYLTGANNLCFWYRCPHCDKFGWLRLTYANGRCYLIENFEW